MEIVPTNILGSITLLFLLWALCNEGTELLPGESWSVDVKITSGHSREREGEREGE